MSEYALVKDEEVKAVIVADETFVATNGAAAAAAVYNAAGGQWIAVPIAGTIGIGWTYTDGIFTAPLP